jgi:hypothetical protein
MGPLHLDQCQLVEVDPLVVLIPPNSIRVHQTQRVAKTAAQLVSVQWIARDKEDLADVLAVADSGFELYKYNNYTLKFVKAVKASVAHHLYLDSPCPVLIILDDKGFCHAITFEHKAFNKSNKVEFKAFHNYKNREYCSSIFLHAM